MSRTDPRPYYGERRPRVAVGGYIRIYDPDHPTAMSDGYVLEHRRMAFDAGLLVDLSMEVHHRNGIPGDNRLDNFLIESPRDHQQHHSLPGSIRKNQHGSFPIVDLATGERMCRDCGLVKPFAEFCVVRSRPDCYCKACRVKRAARYR